MGAAAQLEKKELFAMSVDSVEMGRSDSLRFLVLRWVLEEKYDQAIAELRGVLEGPSVYPTFQPKVERFVHHSIDLIYAIKTKRNFPGINSLTRSKQYELREKYKEHFRELQNVLKTIEKIERNLKVQDTRSIVYVVKAAWIAGFLILLTAFGAEFFRGLARTGVIVFEDSFMQSVDWIFKAIGL